jgi:hypothetical protein
MMFTPSGLSGDMVQTVHLNYNKLMFIDSSKGLFIEFSFIIIYYLFVGSKLMLDHQLL